MNQRISSALICIAVFLFPSVATTEGQNGPSEETVESVYPGLASGILTFAKIAELPENVYLRTDNLEITGSDIEKEITNSPPSVQEQLKKNALFVLEQMAAEKVLLSAAQKQAMKSKTDLENKTKRQIIQDYIEGVAGNVEVTDAEMKAFYEENQDMFGGVPFDDIKDQVRGYVSLQKQQDAVTKYIQTMGTRMIIEVSASWLKEQAVLAGDNPVDKARASGKPSLVDFGASGCIPCDMMAPILDTLKIKYEGTLNVIFVHVREEQILASRYGIRTIPVQVFFDKNGNEVFRHSGFFPQDEIEKRLSEMGVE
ncbi:MAG: thioredoxin domain-containing protein [bacterium]